MLRIVHRLAYVWMAVVVSSLACQAVDDRGWLPTTAASDAATFGSATSASSSSGDTGGADGSDDASDEGSEDDGDDVRFDVGTAVDLAGGSAEDGQQDGCDKVDFLFVVDNSGSMEGEQQNLVTSFPGFISTIENTLMAQDFHVMAIDTDAGPPMGGGIIGCSPTPQCCMSLCTAGAVCNGVPCPVIPSDHPCDETLGAGKDNDAAGAPCSFVGGHRYMIDGQPDLGQAFDCAARVGTAGSFDELQMHAMIEAVSTLNGAGQCNEGFVRDDAILVVTIISDEEDDPNEGDDDNSPGDPATWKQALVDVKHGDEDAVVVLALVGDTNLPGAVCTPMAGNAGAEPAPRLRDFAESFTYGQWGSVCEADYAPFFEQAVSVIDSACDVFKPPG